MNKLYILILLSWCSIFHRKWHKKYWFDAGKDFWQCDKCACHWATSRDMEGF